MYEFVVASCLGMSIGGFLGYRANKYLKGSIYSLLICCGGMLLAIISLDILPHILSEYDIKGVGLGFIIGLLFIIVLNQLLHPLFSSDKSEQTNTFYLLIIGMSIYNLPSGIAIGLHMYDFARLQFLVATFIHDIPEGIAIFLTALLTNKPKQSFFMAVILLSGMILIGIIFGQFFTVTDAKLNAILLGASVGILIFVTVEEIILKSKKHVKTGYSLFSLLIGFGFICLFYI